MKTNVYIELKLDLPADPEPTGWGFFYNLLKDFMPSILPVAEDDIHRAIESMYITYPKMLDMIEETIIHKSRIDGYCIVEESILAEAIEVGPNVKMLDPLVAIFAENIGFTVRHIRNRFIFSQ